MATIERPRPDCSEAEYAAWILQPREGGDMRNILHNAIREVANRYGIQTVLQEVQAYCDRRKRLPSQCA